MAQFRKNVLSQYLRTKCDKQLRLSLYSPPELQAMDWPVPLEARPAVQILRDRGKEWEQAKMQDLETAFGNHLIGVKENGKFKRIELAAVLAVNPPSPTVIVQARFSRQAPAESRRQPGLAAPQKSVTGRTNQAVQIREWFLRASADCYEKAALIPEQANPG